MTSWAAFVDKYLVQEHRSFGLPLISMTESDAALQPNQALQPTPLPVALLFFMSYPRIMKPRPRRWLSLNSLGLVSAHPVWATPLAIALAAIVTPLAIRTLGRAAPPAPSDTLRFESLRAQYHSLELWSQLAAVVGMIGTGACTRSNQQPFGSAA
jgi:hypothetical protein